MMNKFVMTVLTLFSALNVKAEQSKKFVYVIRDAAEVALEDSSALEQMRVNGEVRLLSGKDDITFQTTKKLSPSGKDLLEQLREKGVLTAEPTANRSICDGLPTR